MVGKTCKKDRFWAKSKKEKELRRVEMTTMYMNCHEWHAVSWRRLIRRLTKWDRKLITEMWWCKMKRAICNFWRRRWRWSRNGNRRGGTSVVRGLNRAKFIQVGRFSSSENFVCEREREREREREELVIYAFINFSQCKDLRIGIIWENLGALTTARVRKFWISWKRLSWDLGRLKYRVNYNNQAWSGQSRWRWYWLVWNQGRDGHNEVHEYEKSWI